MKRKTLQFNVAITYSHRYIICECTCNVLTCLNTLHTSGRSFSIHTLLTNNLLHY